MVEWSLANLASWAVQAAAIVALGVWLPMRLRLGAPRARLALFRALLVACIVLPLVQPWTPAPAPVVPMAAAPPPIELTAAGATVAAAPSLAADAASAGFSFARVRAAIAALPWAAIAAVVLTAGAALRLAWLGVGLVSLARLRRSSSPIDPETPAVLEAARIVGTGASFRQSPRVRHPVTFGLHRPVVLVPPGFTVLDPPQQLAIACHELLHVRRQDWLRALGDEVVRALLWFHPAIWWLVEQIRLSAEQLIDREVIGLVGDRRSYLRALLVLAEAGAGPRLQPAPRFLDHGHLQQRVAMLMEEVSMSRMRLVVSATLAFAILASGGWAVVRAFPLQAADLVGQLPVPPAPPVAPIAPVPPPPPPPAAAKAVMAVAPVPPQQPQAAPRPGMTTPSPKIDEATLKQNIQANPTDTSNYFILAKLYEDGGDMTRAVATLEAAIKAVPRDQAVYLQLAGFYNRHGDFPKTMDALNRWSAIAPASPVAHYTISTYYWEKAYRDIALTDAQKRDYVSRGLQAADQAIALNPEYLEALTYKNLLLRTQALLESDPAVQKTLIAEANALRNRAIEIRNARQAAGSPTETYPAPKVASTGAYAGAPPPPPPPPPPAPKQKVTAAAPVPPDAPPPPPPPAVPKKVSAADASLQPKLEAARRQLAQLELRYRPEHPDVVRMKRFIADLEQQMAGNAPPPPPPPASKKVVAAVSIPPDAPPPPPPPDVRVGGTAGGPVYENGEPGLKMPVVVSGGRPDYTREAMQAKITGSVSLSCVVETDGTIRDVTVLTSLDPALDEQAIVAARKWRFEPGTKDGSPVRVRTTIEFTFTLR